MDKFGIDQDALIAQFSQATAQQGEALRNAVHEATLGALRGRELTLKSIAFRSRGSIRRSSP